MKEWFINLSVMEQIFFWLGIVSTLFLIVQIVLMCLSSFGGDVDIDGDGDIDVDADSGVSIFTVKSITAFFAVGSWAGLLTCAVASEKLQWLAIIVALISGAAAMSVMVILLRAIVKLQCNGAFEIEKIIGQQATVYVSVPPSRSGRGKITLTAQGRFMELDAVTDCESRLAVDEVVEIVSSESECTVVKRIEIAAKSEQSEEENKVENKE
ncbi:MAG: hypothetical protein K2N23_06250 [Clostridia bacterium]|nr:hypothetical protein [Clostridia bacterium]